MNMCTGVIVDIWQEEKKKTTEKNQGFSKGGDGVTILLFKFENTCVHLCTVFTNIYITHRRTQVLTRRQGNVIIGLFSECNNGYVIC